MLEIVKTNEEKVDWLKRKHHFLEKRKGSGEYRQKVVAEIIKLDPGDLDYRLKFIHSLFDNQSIWSALTEFMRFEAEVLN